MAPQRPRDHEDKGRNDKAVRPIDILKDQRKN